MRQPVDIAELFLEFPEYRRPFYTPEEFAKTFRYNRQYVWRMIREGKLLAIRPRHDASTYRIPWQAILEFFDPNCLAVHERPPAKMSAGNVGPGR